MGITYIYTYTQGNKAYIGKTKNLNKRKSDHKPRFGGWDYNIIDSVNSFDKSEWKPLESYWIEQFRQWGYNLANKNKAGSGKDGFRTEEEKKQIWKQWYLNNREKELEYHQQQRLVNPEYNKQYHLANKEKWKGYNKKYHSTNKEKINEYHRQRYLNKKTNIY